MRVRTSIAIMGLMLLSFASFALADPIDDFRSSGVTIAMSAYWKPYTFVEGNNRPAGFLVDYWTKWSEKTGVPVHFEPMTWDETINAVAEGKVDIHSGLYRTDERESFMDFSHSLYASKGVVVTSKNGSCRDIYTYVWGAIAGSFEETYVRTYYPATDLVTYQDTLTLLRAFSTNEVGVVLVDLPSLVVLSGRIGVDDTVNICETAYERNIHAGVTRHKPAEVASENWTTA